ncbi:MAG: MurR/RpiR family transcriptional regulator [Variibacter sp.]
MAVDVLTERLLDEFASMPPRLQAAARFVLEQPQDVALLTMREQARRAGVPPATMTRLAQRLGLSGYEALRGNYAAALRKSAATYEMKASELVAQRGVRRPQAVSGDMAQMLSANVAALGGGEARERLAEAAATLATAGHLFCLGLRSSFPVAFLFHYICELAGCAVTLLDGAGSTGMDKLASAGPRDALLVVSVAPYTRTTVEAAKQAKKSGLRLVAITDRATAPLASIAHHKILVATTSPSFFDSKTSALAAVEILAMLVTMRRGKRAATAVKARESYLTSINAYWPSSARENAS